MRKSATEMEEFFYLLKNSGWIQIIKVKTSMKWLLSIVLSNIGMSGSGISITEQYEYG